MRRLQKKSWEGGAALQAGTLVTALHRGSFARSRAPSFWEGEGRQQSLRSGGAPTSSQQADTRRKIQVQQGRKKSNSRVGYLKSLKRVGAIELKSRLRKVSQEWVSKQMCTKEKGLRRPKSGKSQEGAGTVEKACSGSEKKGLRNHTRYKTLEAYHTIDHGGRENRPNECAYPPSLRPF